MNDINDPVYLFCYFKGHGDGLHLAWSHDGFHWQALNQDLPYITGQTGPEKLMRDPFVMAAPDGLFHLVWTAGWRGNGIGYASSPDLRNWSFQKFLNVMSHEPETRNCWAPEIFYDDRHDQYIIYWASSIPGRYPETDDMGDEGLNHRMYYTTTKDFKTFAETRIFFDAGFNVIDATLVKDQDRYLLFFKDETSRPLQKNIRFAVANGIFDGFKEVSKPLTGAYWAEGPSVVKINERWVVYFDKYKLNRMGAVTSGDLIHWEDVSDQLHFPEGAQHGAVQKIALDRISHLF